MPKASPGHEVLELATVSQLAKILGISRRAVYSAVERGEIQAHRIKPKGGDAVNSTKMLYFTKQDVIDYVQWKYGGDEDE